MKITLPTKREVDEGCEESRAKTAILSTMATLRIQIESGEDLRGVTITPDSDLIARIVDLFDETEWSIEYRELAVDDLGDAKYYIYSYEITHDPDAFEEEE